jgi:hypothetical protein
VYLPWWASLPAVLAAEVCVWLALAVGVFVGWYAALLTAILVPAVAAWACASIGPLRQVVKKSSALSFYPGKL